MIIIKVVTISLVKLFKDIAMNKKIFAALKQEYSHLGLGDVILQAHADALAKLGLVTDDNINTVVSAQKDFLEGLQKSNDLRVTEAVKRAKDTAKKEFEEETQKKEKERKEAEEKARLEAEEKAKKEAEEKAKAEAEEKRLEEIRKNQEMPEFFKKFVEEQAAKEKAAQEAYEARITQLTKANTDSAAAFTKMIEDLKTQNQGLLDGFTAMKQESEKAKAEKAQRERSEMILSKARELGIPQYRIDEGFNIAPDADEHTITEFLGKVSQNIKANVLPGSQSFQMGDGSASKEDMDALAKQMIK